MALTTSESTASTSERRQVTILHCDIVNSTYISEHVDPEELQLLIHQFVNTCEQVVNKSSGRMAGFTGDGIEVFFGYPTADENSTIDSLLSALSIQTKISQISIPGSAEEKLQIRIGVATGLVVTEVPKNSSTGKSLLAFGTPTHLAARLEEAANPGQVYVDDNTKKLCESEFQFTEIGELDLKGIESGQVYWRLLKHRPTNSRFEQKIQKLTPFIGRDEEVTLINNMWDGTLSGNGGIVFITGEAGIGKSRLVHEVLSDSYDKPGVYFFMTQCSPRLTSSPLAPWLISIEQLCIRRSENLLGGKKEKLQYFLTQDLGFSEIFVTILLSMMDLSNVEEKKIQDISAPMRLEIITKGFVEFFLRTAIPKPVLLVIEDLHWADATSVALLEKLAVAIPKNHLLIVVTSRIFHPMIQEFPETTSVTLEKLNYKQTTKLIQLLTESSHLRASSIEAIGRRTDGNPLFVEEVTRNMLGQLVEDKNSILDAVVPSSLQNLLLDRLDRLGNVKDIAQIAATIGREFDLSMLVVVKGGQKDREVDEAIKKLAEAEIIREIDAKANKYIFHHALFQKAAYDSQLMPRRVAIHAKIARTLVFNRRQGVFQPEIVAYHFQEAGNSGQAFKYWVKAGTLGLKVGATVEAVRVLNNAQTLFNKIEDNRQGLVAKLKYYIVRGKALNASVGAKSDEAVNAFRQAGSISKSLGVQYVSEQVHAHDSEFGIIYNSGDLKASLGPAEAMIQVGKQQNCLIGTICGLQAMGMTMFQMGEFNEAKDHLERAIVDADSHRVGINSYPSLALTLLSHTCYILDEKKEALKYCKRSIASGAKESPYSHAISLANSCYLFLFDDDLKMMEQKCKDFLKLAESIGQLIWMKRGLIIKHWLEAKESKDIESLNTIIGLVNELREANEEIDMTVFFDMIATTQMEFGLFEEAAKSLDTAIEISGKTNEQHYLAEVYRHYAELMDEVGDQRAGEFRVKARLLAVKQGAKAWFNRLEL